ncbi:uncharacterized protein LOC132038198 [Lycium ferocissimum]|uniref:uncharacterized protein LOC132038198 n=1 Tax=Lycium ferocissimum TaxID=112874 RepID=UPI002815C05D|nr:uncharacterized protein LOC132038198 [Lycium ferocissimum]
MSVQILDGATILNFVEDEEAFSEFIAERFSNLDKDHDGMLSYPEMLKELRYTWWSSHIGLRVFDTHFGIDVKTDPNEVSRVYSSIFVQFDRDSNGTVDMEEFKQETKEMMVAMANGLGFLPVQMVLEENSFLKKS